MANFLNPFSNPYLATSLILKEYARAEEVLAGFGANWVLASDLSHGIGVSETAEY
jgi:hypothetical protein